MEARACNRLKGWFHKRRITQLMISERTGVHIESIKAYMNGKPMSKRTALILAGAFGLNVDFLLTGKGDIAARVIPTVKTSVQSAKCETKVSETNTPQPQPNTSKVDCEFGENATAILELVKKGVIYPAFYVRELLEKISDRDSKISKLTVELETYRGLFAK